VLEAVEAKYGVKLPRRVVTVDYGGDVGDIFVKFKHAEHTEGEAAADGNLTFNHLPTHPPNTHDDQLWALALAAYAAQG
jgi:hypothetical protein